MEQFDRQYLFAAGPSGGTGFEVGKVSPERPSALHISFEVQKADTETPDTAKISLWNLSPEQLAILDEEDCVVTLRAGYGNHLTLIFVGTVTYIETQADGADVETTIEASDGRKELRDCYVSLSYSGVIGARKIIEDIAADMGVAVSFSYNATFADMPNGFSFVGPGRVGLDKACASSGLHWQIQNGVLQVRMSRDTMTREVYILSPDTGLWDIPTKITYGKDAVADGEQSGWQVVYLLNGAIGVGDYVRLESKKVTGYFRVKSVDMHGDNMEQGWTCAAKLIAG